MNLMFIQDLITTVIAIVIGVVLGFIVGWYDARKNTKKNDDSNNPYKGHKSTMDYMIEIEQGNKDNPKGWKGLPSVKEWSDI